MNLKNWGNSIEDPTEYYLDAFRYYIFNLPSQLRSHKRYFRKESRGFGENAFHTLWYMLYEKYKFLNFLEIGIYRGQTISLLALIAKLKDKNIFLQGISPFDNTGDKVSGYKELDYLKDVLDNFEYLSLEKPKLLRAFSTDPSAVELISSKYWDCIYIDGSHDIEIVKKDWLICSQHIRIGGVVVFDDAALYTAYRPPFFAFKGHPGPSTVADGIEENNSNYKEILRVGHNRVFERLF